MQQANGDPRPTLRPSANGSSLDEQSPFYPLEPGRVLLETDNALAFLDKYPVSPGHALVIPRRVEPCLYHLPAQHQADVWQTVALTRELLAERYETDAFNIGINDGRCAGQTVMHAHVHIIPRYQGDCQDPRGGIRWIVPAKAVYWRACNCS